MEVLRVLSAVSLGERVDLDPEGDALLPAVLSGSELCADAVHLQTGAQAFYECAAFKVATPTGGTKRRLCVSVCVCVRYLHKHRGSFLHVPQELCGVELRGVSLGLHDAHRHGDICPTQTHRQPQQSAAN